MNNHKLTEGTDQKVIDVINKHNVTVINNMEDILELFDPTSLSNDPPTIKADHNAIIMFDHPLFNSAYVHEYLDILLTDKSNVCQALDFPKNIPPERLTELIATFQQKFDIIEPTIKLYYCNNVELNEQLFKPFFKNIFDSIVGQAEEDSPLKNQPFEYDCPSVLLTVNPKAKMVTIDYEKAFPFNVHSIFSQYIITYDGIHVRDANERKKEDLQKEKEEDSINKTGGQQIPKNPKHKA